MLGFFAFLAITVLLTFGVETGLETGLEKIFYEDREYYNLSYRFQSYSGLRVVSWNNTELQRLVNTTFYYNSLGLKYTCPVSLEKDTTYFPVNLFSFLPENMSTYLSFASSCINVLQYIKGDATPYLELCQDFQTLLDQHLKTKYFALGITHLLNGPDFVDFYQMQLNGVCTALMDAQYTKCITDSRGDRKILPVDFWMTLFEFQPWICFSSNFDLLFLPEPWRTQKGYAGTSYTTQEDFHKDALYNDGLYFSYPVNMYERYCLKCGVQYCYVSKK